MLRQPCEPRSKVWDTKGSDSSHPSYRTHRLIAATVAAAVEMLAARARQRPRPPPVREREWSLPEPLAVCGRPHQSVLEQSCFTACAVNRLVGC